MKTEELIENYLVYTDNGIENVHWCNVNGVKELVSPKGKIYGYVPDYFENKRLHEQLSEANEVIENMKLCMDDKYDYDCVAEDVDIYIKKWGVK